MEILQLLTAIAILINCLLLRVLSKQLDEIHTMMWALETSQEDIKHNLGKASQQNPYPWGTIRR